MPKIESILHKKIQNEKSTLQLIAEDIVFIEYKENAVLKPHDFDEVVAAFEELSQKNTLKALSEFGLYTTATPEARKHAGQVRVSCIAEAVIFQGLAQRILLKFHIIFRKQPHPFKIFQSKENAIKWLNQF